MSTLSTHLYELRRRLDELKPIDFQPTIIGLDVTEVPPEQAHLWMMEFRESEASHYLARKADMYAAADEMAEFSRHAEWADTVPMGEEVAA
jgi:hypothetical protein